MQGVINGFGHTAFAFAEACTHDGYATIFQDGFNVGKVEVHGSSHGDNLCNTFGGNGECIIGFSESIHEGQIRINFAQAFVIDDQQGINVLCNAFNTVQRLNNFLFSFENERNGYNTYGQYIHFFSNTGNNRSSTCSCSATHTGGYEHHLGSVVQQIFNFFNAFFGGVFCPVGAVTCTESFGYGTPQL
ncbi:hypothetical protein SDC9_80817 [bioreactor metagenome]|uniref:Uncharacterized protein n=1 Tax=bioreactor metagenome TaxID=1076179 RepID=A0A644Z019_9ZZZZ